MIRFLLTLTLLLTSVSEAAELRLLDLDYLGMEYRKHVNYRDSYYHDYEIVDGKCSFQSECFGYGANILFDFTLVQFPLNINYEPVRLFWRNDVGMDSTNKQVRQVGWLYEFGLALGKDIELFTRHHSRHVLEAENTYYGFPLRDEYVIRFNIYERKRGSK